MHFVIGEAFDAGYGLRLFWLYRGGVPAKFDCDGVYKAGEFSQGGVVDAVFDDFPFLWFWWCARSSGRCRRLEHRGRWRRRAA